VLINPFTPSEIAGGPNEFFGRSKELNLFERAIRQGSVALQGGIGIGKSSLLARGILSLEGFDSSHRAQSMIAVGHKDITSVDEAARLLLEAFIRVDEQSSKISFKIGSILDIESAEICRFFKEGRHLAALKRIIEDDYLKRVFRDRAYLLFAIDEADKCPKAFAQVMRAIVTHVQHKGIKGIRFVAAGVSPFFQEMVNEDPGISRFFYKVVPLGPMDTTEARDLLETKLTQVKSAAAHEGIALRIDPDVVEKIISFSGGHPHILQLLGSHLIEHEDEDPDNIIDARDLVGALRRICYEDRSYVYASTIHKLEVHNKLETVNVFLGLSTEFSGALLLPGFPTKINRKLAQECVPLADIQWLIDHSILCAPSGEHYGLVDEFLRIRLILDALDRESDQQAWEKKIISGVVNTSYFSKQERIRRRTEEEGLLGVQLDDIEDYLEEELDDE
jgi:hypothetical protein